VKYMNSRETIVLKFGGASVAHVEQFSKIAEIISTKSPHYRVVVVVSAMGDSTDELLSLARCVHPNPPLREQDMLVSAGERISSALLSMSLNLRGISAISFTGSQSGIITSSRHSEAMILDVRPRRVEQALDAGHVVIVAGFQGVSTEGEITTLGRGGSDTTAIALGVALDAIKVEFYKDVEGIYSADPKLDKGAILYRTLSFDEATNIADQGAQVLHPRCIRLASKNNLPIHVLSFYDPLLLHHQGTLIGSADQKEKGLHVFEEEEYGSIYRF
jgi:aspartate kinase